MFSHVCVCVSSVCDFTVFRPELISILPPVDIDMHICNVYIIKYQSRVGFCASRPLCIKTIYNKLYYYCHDKHTTLPRFFDPQSARARAKSRSVPFACAHTHITMRLYGAELCSRRSEVLYAPCVCALWDVVFRDENR